MTVAVVLALALALAGITYLVLERLGRQAWIPLLCRAVAWGALGALVLDLGCAARTRPLPPLVLLDASLSLRAAGGRWAEARDSAARWGEVRLFGDDRPAGARAAADTASDSVPARGRSLLAPALIAASASERPVLVVTDGELEDLADVPPDLRERMGVRLFPRRTSDDVAMGQVSAPARVTAGDSIPLDLEIRAVGSVPESATVEVSAAGRTLLRRRLGLREGSTRATLSAPSAGLPAGPHLLSVALADAADPEPRDDARLVLVSVTATPGVVLLANPPDWDARFLYRTLKDVARLPVRGYVLLEPGRWRTMDGLRPVGTDDVRRAARQADLLILKGAAGDLADGTRARGVLAWPSGENGESVIPGDWYISVGGASPLAGAFLGLPLDSFPPAVRITPMQPGPTEWVALVAQAGRRGPERPVVLGREEGRTRRIVVAADGLWRWAFRGGSSEQGYRSMVAAAASWLLGGADTVQGRARPVRPVVANARPLVFEWSGGGAPQPTAITLTGPGGVVRDTLRFDGQGRAMLRLPVGEYRYRLEGGGGGLAAVELNSDEWFPRPVVLEGQPVRAVQATARTSARDQVWLFALCVLALAGEWAARRRLGLR